MKVFIHSVLFLFLCFVMFGSRLSQSARGDTNQLSWLRSGNEYSCTYTDTKTGRVFDYSPNNFKECTHYTGESIAADQFYSNRCRVKECQTAEQNFCPTAQATGAEKDSRAYCIKRVARGKKVRAIATTSDKILSLIEQKEAAGEARTLAEQTIRIESLRIKNNQLGAELTELRDRLNALKTVYLPVYQQQMNELAQRQSSLLNSIDQNDPGSLSAALEAILDLKNERLLTNALVLKEVDETQKRAVAFCGNASYEPYLNQVGVNTDSAQAKVSNFCDMAIRRLEKRANELTNIGLEIESSFEPLYNQLLAKRSLKQMQVASEELKQKIGPAAHLSAVNRFLKDVEGSYAKYKEAEPQQGIPPLGFSEFIRRTRSFLAFEKLCENISNRPSYIEAGCNRFNEKREAVSSRNSRMAGLMTLSLEIVAQKISSDVSFLNDRAKQAIDQGNLSAAAALVDFLIEDAKRNGGAQ